MRPEVRRPLTSTVRGPTRRPSPSTTVMPRPLTRPGQALEEAADDAVLVLVDAAHVDALERGVDAELLGLAGGVGDLGRVQQGLGRDAADVQAGAAELALLDQGHRRGRAGPRAGRRRSRRCLPRGPPRRSSSPVATGVGLRLVRSARPAVPGSPRRCPEPSLHQTPRLSTPWPVATRSGGAMFRRSRTDAAHWAHGLAGSVPSRRQHEACAVRGRSGAATTVRASDAADEQHLARVRHAPAAASRASSSRAPRSAT